MQHSFDVEIAKEYGIIEAILLNNFEYWIAKNKANNQNFYDGYYWTYNSTRAFNELFPYVSQRQIQNALKHLREEGILQTGNYNKLAYDRTLWYAFTEKGESIMQKCQMHYAKMSNGNGENVEAIPYINTDSNTNINTDKNILSESVNVTESEDGIKITAKLNDNGKEYAKSRLISDIVNYLNQQAGTSFRASSKATQQHINARLAEGFTIDDFFTVINKKCAEWLGTDFAQYLRPATLFGTKFEAYLNAPVRQTKKYGQTGVAINTPEDDDLEGIL